jgi:hypothetical protein
MFPSYSELGEDDIAFLFDIYLAFHGDGKLNIYDIDCHEKSAIVFKGAFMEKRIKSYTGVNTNEEEALKMRRKGLLGFLINGDEDIIQGLDALKKAGHGVVVMLGLPETAPEKAMRYRNEAEKRGLKVIAYPPIKA